MDMFRTDLRGEVIRRVNPLDEQLFCGSSACVVLVVLITLIKGKT